MNKGQVTPWLRPVYPAQIYESNALVAVDTHYVPMILADLEARKSKSLWVDETEWAIGYQALCEQGVDLLMPATTAIVESIDRVYRLLDNALNGAVYSAAIAPSTGEITYSPEIPPVPPVNPPTATAAMRAQLARARQLLDNLVAGTEAPAGSALADAVALDFDGSLQARLRAVQGETGGFFGIGAQAVTLADLLKAGRVNTTADQGLINDGFEEILAAVSQGSNIGQVLSSLLNTGADIATDGGVIAATLAASLAQAVTAATLSSQLDRLIRSLDGGGLVGPSDNVLQALRGTEESTVTRNLVDVAGETRDLLKP